MADQILQNIKDKLDIVDFISTYLPLKKSGANFKTNCPFHGEKTASFMVSREKQIWHCFGCGEGGDIFRFLMKQENLEFREALKILADKAGVELPRYSPKDKEREDRREYLFRVNDFASQVFHKFLTQDPRGKLAMEYLLNRGLKVETIQKWRIGFAPDDFHFLENTAKQKNISPRDLQEAGLSSPGGRSGSFDRFRGRIVFPIFDYFGRVAGFTGRILKDDEKSAKYINTPETAIYSKSKILFGMNFAKTAIRKADEVIIVEGQMDAISCHQHGFENAVASSGTAFTEEQIKQINRLTRNLKFCFDGDAAGAKAARRAVESYLGRDLNIKIMELSEGKDPDEQLKINPVGFKKSVNDAKLFLDYYLDKSLHQYSDSSVEEKQRVARDVLPLLSKLTDPLGIDHYLNLASGRMGVPYGALAKSLEKIAVQVKNASVKNIHTQVVQASNSGLEKEIIGGLLLFSDFLHSVISQAESEDFTLFEAKKFIEEVKKYNAILPENRTSDFAKECQMVSEENLTKSEGEDVYQRQLMRSFALIKSASLKRQQKELARGIKEAQKQQDRILLAELNARFAKLTSFRLKYEKQMS